MAKGDSEKAKASPRNNAAKTRSNGVPIGTPFPKGNPGRPKGSRNKLGEAFLAAMHADFQEHGVAAIEQVRAEKPDQYLKVIASLLPKDLNITVNKFDELSDEELIDRLRNLESVIRPFLGDKGSNRDHGGTGSPTAH